MHSTSSARSSSGPSLIRCSARCSMSYRWSSDSAVYRPIAVARALVAAGLHPALGLHHTGRSNAFCLADDLLEPLRPMVDARVRDLVGGDRLVLDQPTKAHLLEVLTDTVAIGDQAGPLMVGLHRFVASLVRCYQGTDKTLVFPITVEDES